MGYVTVRAGMPRISRKCGILSLALPFVAALVTSSSSDAQPSLKRPGFEAASIRANVGAAENMGAFAQPGGRFGARNVPVKFLIRNAYGVKDFQIISTGFSWINLDRYDINAKAPAGTFDGFEGVRPMHTDLRCRASATHCQTYWAGWWLTRLASPESSTGM